MRQFSSYFGFKFNNLGLDGNMPYNTFFKIIYLNKPKYVTNFHLNDDNDEGRIFKKFNVNLAKDILLQRKL